MKQINLFDKELGRYFPGGDLMKNLLYIFIILNHVVIQAQSDQNSFSKVAIEIDGEEVFDMRSIVQDHQGFIWMGTNLGLIRYNGFEAKKYSSIPSDMLSEVNEIITSLFVDFQGGIWVLASAGLSKYNSECDCFQHYPVSIENSSLGKVQSITEDNTNNLWIGTSKGELFKYERASDGFKKFLDIGLDPILTENDNIEQLLVDKKNNLWIGTNAYDSKNGSGLIRYNITTGNVKQFLHDPSNPKSLLDNRISTLYEDQQGQILVGTYKCGLHSYNETNESINRINDVIDEPNQLHAPYSIDKVFGNDPFVQIIHQDQNGGYWIGTTGKGINHFNATNNSTIHYSFNLVNPQLLWSFYEDRQGNIWIGGIMGGGLYKTDIFARKYTLNTNFINVQGAYESTLNPGILWIESLQQGLSKMNLKTNEITRYLHKKNDPKSIGHNWVRSAYQENSNILWFGLGIGDEKGGQAGDGGLDRMDIETGEFTHFKLTRNDDGRDDFSYTPHSICEDSEGYLWLGTGPGGIFKSDKNKREINHLDLSKNGNISDDAIFNIVRIDSNGDLWASDFSGVGTLYLYNRKEEIFNPYLKGFKVYNLIVDEKGWLLLSTWENGLVHLNPANSNYNQYTKKDGLPSNIALDIVRGNESTVWITTRMGPAKFDTKTGEIATLNLLKGRYNSRIFKAGDGQIYLAANNGLVSFYPHNVTGNPFPPQIVISEMMMSDTNYLANKNNANKLSLSYNQNDISFKYTGLHYSNSKKNAYKYRLKPLNDQWINAGFERTARFFNLSPGSYNFEVKTSNSDGLWSDTPESIQFTIKPSWWTTWWAYTMYLGIIIFLTDRIYRFQLSRRIAANESKRLKEVNQLKNTLFTNITHEFRTPLTVIKGMTDAVKSNIANKQFDTVKNSLGMIERNSDSLLQLVNEMLDLAKIESGNMELQLVQSDVIPFLKYLSESFSSLAEENHVSLTVYAEIDSLIMDFDANKLTSVISNLLSNSIKFTNEFGKIIVHINQITKNDQLYLFIKIIDNGIGISKEELPNIFNRFYQTDATTIRKNEGTGIGLALAKELVELMSGTIEVKSKLHKGSEFSLMIPVTRKAPRSKKVQMNNVSQAALPNLQTVEVEQSIEENSDLPLVLIIEDNMDVAHYLKTCLINTYKTMHAVNGIEGIEMALEKIPDIIICDVMMPGKDGFEVCKTLKSDERSDHIPIIILTAKVTIEDRLTGLSHGADAYLAKPFNKEELFTRLDQLVLSRKKLISKIQNDGFNTLLKNPTKNLKLQFLQKVIKLVHEDIDNSKFGSGELAKELCISESQIYRKVKAITGKSTAVFIRSVRLKYAKELLSSTDKTVSEVAYDVGFNDPSWFSRAFKDEFGFSPSTTSK